MKQFYPIVAALILLSCKPEQNEPKPTSLPSVVTGEINSITATSAIATGEVITDGNLDVTDRGIVLSSTVDPTVDDDKINNGLGIGSFSVDLSALSPGSTYYVRAYASNSLGTAYGLNKSFTTISVLPTLTTTEITELTTTSALGGGNISADGGSPIIARGLCWSTGQNPTVSDSVSVNGTGPGIFISSIANLRSSTTYYIRAYATNSNGTAYGNQLTIITLPDPLKVGLIGWWPFDGDALDKSGNQNDGSMNNVVAATDRWGNQAGAFDFDGASSVITCNNPGPANGSAFSVSIWVKSNSTAPAFLVSWGNDGLTGQDFRLAQGQVGSCTFGIQTETYNDSKGVNALIPENWTHYAITYNPSNGNNVSSFLIYRNGSFVNELCNAQNNFSINIGTGKPVTFGRYSGTVQSAYFTGQLDDAAIWNRVLTADEINQLYTGTLP